ncbi:DCC1-like thiol-disulfide oxidoreductase family protein [Natrinema sp. 74]|uniref:DCC1-like thiol-disulfide oxidoreductase family protein n=1 Tax=Natrinema sp. 74 TaxID=3384159 RepID=UPI0038D4E32D
MDCVPKLVYDDTCHFCTWSATFAVRRSDIQPVRLSEVQNGRSRLSDFERDHLPADYEECAQLLTETAVYSCGAAMEESLIIAGILPRRPIEFLRQFETYGRLRERTYHWMSNNRDYLANVIGRDPPVSDHVSDDDVYPKRSS